MTSIRPAEDSSETALEEALDAFSALTEEDPAAALEMFASLPEEVQARAEFQFELAVVLREAGKLERAEAILRQLTEATPNDSDAHHLLGDVLEDLGQSQEALVHFLETLALDRGEYETTPQAVRLALEEKVAKRARETILDLPEPFRNRLSSVPIFVEALPDEEMVRLGLDPRALGLFDGATSSELADAPPVPTRIVIFSANLQSAFLEEDELLDQVEVTVLHEIGHFFDLEEDDLARLGLD